MHEIAQLPAEVATRAEARLVEDGILHTVDGRLRTTRRWQGAMMRALGRALANGDAGEDEDLRALVAFALVELYRGRLETEALAELVLFMLPIEARELLPSPDGRAP